MPAPHRLVFTGQMPFLPPNQQCQSTEGLTITTLTVSKKKISFINMHNSEQKLNPNCIPNNINKCPKKFGIGTYLPCTPTFAWFL